MQDDGQGAGQDDERELRAAGFDGLDKLLAFALLLPPLLLSWPGPGSLLRDDFLPQATGAGASALATLPAAAILALRRRGSVFSGWASGALFLLVPLLFVAMSLGSRRVLDSFEARRALMHWATALALFLGGARLASRGLRIYSRGIVCVALLLLAYAHLDAENGFAGALGNTGSVAEAALPGALAGICLSFEAKRESRTWRAFGAIALLLFLAYAARVPVIAGGIALGAGLAAFGLGRRGLSRTLRGLWLTAALAAASCVLAPFAITSSRHADPGSGAGSDAGAAARTAGNAGGFEVRTRIWSRSLAMFADHPWLGVGAGQFAASFPPYRDPREIEISTHGRALPAETEVEHPHQDWLAPALELGLLAGLGWIAFLLAVARGARLALRGEEVRRAALGAASLGILTYALVHAPLTVEPAAASIAFVVFGAVLARPGTPSILFSRRWLSVVSLALLVALAPVATAFVRHGRALSALASPGERQASEVERALASALAACPDSVFALALAARLAEERGADPAVVCAAWEAVLLRRPARVEARMQLGLAFVRAGDFSRAREEYEQALALDPGHPGILRNLLLLDLQEGRFDAGRRWLQGLDAGDPSPEQCFARAKSERAGGDVVLADLLEARAHLLWARQHAAGGRFQDAVRSYRQCLRVTREHIQGGAARVRLELAAALLADGRGTEARVELDAIHPNLEDRSALPAWADERLRTLEPGK